ncbi:precorrin-3B C(17)-methyltransferase [Pelagibaculum spongiae]|nr:precorrin-3B C(17)-methyltransferase [Pelagibaculum spongiae]
MKKIKGKLSVVGLGPGCADLITPRAISAIESADLVVGLDELLAQVEHLLPGKEVVTSSRSEEVPRALAAVSAALKGRRVALLASGDPGVYSIGSLAQAALRDQSWHRGSSSQFEIIPGIPSAQSCASLIGVPLGHDNCTISLSDLLSSWDDIKSKIAFAARADFAITLYNPSGKNSQNQMVEVREILLQHLSACVPVAIIKSAYQPDQSIVLSDLMHFLAHNIDGDSTVIIGNTRSYIYEGLMGTHRGYGETYDLVTGELRKAD